MRCSDMPTFLVLTLIYRGAAHIHDEFAPLSGSNDSPYQLSAVNMDDYDISKLEPITKGQSKAKVKKNDGPTKCTPAESLALAKFYIDVSEDAIIGNYQKHQLFWERVVEKYNAGRPKATPERDREMLRKH
ncbi:unnamed protein product [Cuscuta campestris]|uniref:No apical meristem-associated C-terminal domain-containing protein n=1 Tax=Cuscuta campestris TaxID=132261 RepID=A0A484KIK6_9ASTE|nr:unnamed protein product [Cuscuta campestris]